MAKTQQPSDGNQASAKVRETTLVTQLCVNGADKAIDWYVKALGAKELNRNREPGGKVIHASLQIGNSYLFLNDVMPNTPLKDPKASGATCIVHLNVDDVDKAWKKVTDEGAKPTMPLADQFWGERYGQVVDPFGCLWSMSSPIQLTEAQRKQMEKQTMEMFASRTSALPGKQ